MKTLTLLITIAFAAFINPMFIDETTFQHDGEVEFLSEQDGDFGAHEVSKRIDYIVLSEACFYTDLSVGNFYSQTYYSTGLAENNLGVSDIPETSPTPGINFISLSDKDKPTNKIVTLNLNITNELLTPDSYWGKN